MFKQTLMHYTFTSGAVFIMLVFFVTFLCILYMGYRKKSQPVFDRASQLPLTED